MNYTKAIEIYLCRSLDFDADVVLSEIDGVTTIDVWNIPDKPKPTLAELAALSDKVEALDVIDAKIEKARRLRAGLNDRDVEYDRWRRILIQAEKKYLREREVVING